MRRPLITLIALAVLAVPATATARTLPTAVARAKSASVARSHWKAERFHLLDRVRATKCKRLASTKVRCGTTVDMEDEYGCGYGTAQVTVRFAYPTGYSLLTKVTHDDWHPFYGAKAIINNEFDDVSCAQFGL